LSSPEVPTPANTSQPAPLPEDPLPERVAAIALLIPVLLTVALPAVTGINGSAGPVELSDRGLAGALGLEVVLTATLGWWLWRKGWRPHRSATLPFSPGDFARGIGLWVAAILSVALWSAILRVVVPDVITIANQTQFVGAPSLWVSVTYSVFNAVFEELLWLGIGLTAFRRLGLPVAGAISAALRVLAHAYQGPLAVVTVAPIAILFTAYYIRTRRLWPVVVAHAFQDILALEILRSVAETRSPG
jgi:membrane protease YdiL (CAAX protease family)